jgi:hypothetical protein
LDRNVEKYGKKRQREALRCPNGWKEVSSWVKNVAIMRNDESRIMKGRLVPDGTRTRKEWSSEVQWHKRNSIEAHEEECKW